MVQLTITDAIREQVAGVFDGFIGNAEAIHGIKRSLMVALAKSPVALDKTFLLIGPPSAGKTEIARRMTKCLGVPFVQIDGRNVRTREKLFEMLDDALRERGIKPKPASTRSGMPVVEYSGFLIFVDEVHQMADGAQNSLLTLLERDDRSVVLDDATHGRRVATVREAAFVFATTKPAGIIDPLRSRCSEIVLERYSAEEIVAMVQLRGTHLPAQTLMQVATASRLVPRIAFEMAREIEEEILCDPKGDIKAAFSSVLRGRGVLTYTGLNRIDLRYLAQLAAQKRPVGEQVILARLGDIDRATIQEDTEPFLLRNDYIDIKDRGRVITWRGQKVVDEF
jgi:Holliday junction resolvasome RuvABC ATP-dependent DNA helicase subunit